MCIYIYIYIHTNVTHTTCRVSFVGAGDLNGVGPWLDLMRSAIIYGHIVCMGCMYVSMYVCICV